MNQHERPHTGQFLWTNEEIVELSLLLPGWQAAELANLAGGQGLTLGQLLRRVIGEYLARQSDLGPGVSPREFALMKGRCPAAVFGSAAESSTGIQNGSSKVPTTKEEEQ